MLYSCYLKHAQFVELCDGCACKLRSTPDTRVLSSLLSQVTKAELALSLLPDIGLAVSGQSLLIWAPGKRHAHGLGFLPGLSEKDEQDVPHMKVLTSNITPKTAQLTGNQWINQKKP